MARKVESSEFPERDQTTKVRWKRGPRPAEPVRASPAKVTPDESRRKTLQKAGVPMPAKGRKRK